MPFNDISYLELWRHCFKQSGTICVILVEGSMRNDSVNYLELGQVVQEMPFNDISYLKLWQPFCSAERNHLCNFGRGYQEEHSMKLFRIWTSDSGRNVLKISLSGALPAILFSRVESFVQFW